MFIDSKTYFCCGVRIPTCGGSTSYRASLVWSRILGGWVAFSWIPFILNEQCQVGLGISWISLYSGLGASEGWVIFCIDFPYSVLDGVQGLGILLWMFLHAGMRIPTGWVAFPMDFP